MALIFPAPAQIKNLLAPTDNTDAATKLYVDTQVSGASVSASGSNTQVQFNSAGSFSASSNLTFNSSTNLLTVTGNVATTNLSVTGNVTLTGANVSLGNISNLHIGGGTADYVLKTDGAGNLSWTAQNTSTLTADVDAFTGDGSNVAFTLANTPAGENYTMVAVQGILQPKTTYSLSGNVLTFSSAPPSTAIIEVTTFGGSVSIGGGGSGGSLTAVYRGYTGDGSNTAYTVTSGVTANTVLVATNGVLQRPTTDYTISGSTLTFVVAPDNSDDIQIRELSTTGSSGSSSSALTWNIASSNVTMTKNNGYFVDTSSGSKTMTLPTIATLGDTIRINDLAGTFGTNNLTIARNGHKIQGLSDNLLVNVDETSFGLVYSNSTYGWKVLEL